MSFFSPRTVFVSLNLVQWINAIDEHTFEQSEKYKLCLGTVRIDSTLY